MRQYIDTLQDVQGNALVGAAVLVQNYIGGGNASIFSDNGLTPIVTSTVSTGADGQFSFFAADGDYNLVMSKNATVFKTQSPVSLFDGAAQLTYADGGSVNAIAINNSTLEKALRVGLRASFQLGITNTGACTFSYNGLAAKPLTLPGAIAMPAGLLVATGIYHCEYDGTRWQLSLSATPNIAPTAAEIAAVVSIVNATLKPGNVLRYQTNTTPGTTDMSAGFQAAFNQQSNGGVGAAPVYAPSGTYLIGSVIATTAAGSFTMYGDGMGKTLISKSVDADCFVVTNSGSAFNQITITDMTIAAGVAMAAGSALNLSCTGILPSVTLRDVMILCGGSFTFATAIKLNNCGDCNLTRVWIKGIDTTSMVGIAVTASQTATVYKFVACSIYECSSGVTFTGTSDPAIEGVQFYGCDIVGVQFGVIYTNSFGPTYFPPQFTWIGGHINSSSIGISLNVMTDVVIQGLLSYNNGSNEHINLNIVGDLNIQGCTFVQTGGAADGIVMQSANGPLNGGMIANNVFRMGSTGNALTMVTANYINLIVANLLRVAGTRDVAFIGSPDPSIIVLANTPSVAGWGTPTGPSVVANFSGTAATLVQCSNAIAEIITYLKARGDFQA
jgi:hypothetical protein